MLVQARHEFRYMVATQEISPIKLAGINTIDNNIESYISCNKESQAVTNFGIASSVQFHGRQPPLKR